MSAIEFAPTAPLENLRRRAALYHEIRSYFDSLDFVEVSTPTLSRDVVVDRFVESIPVEVSRCWPERDELARIRFEDEAEARRMASTFYLQTSPEFAMKRLVAAGMPAIYQLAPAYRRGDRGSLHNVEFTMLEWYRAGDDYLAGRKLLADIVAEVGKAFYARTGLTPQSWSTRRTTERSFGEAFETLTGLNPHASDIPTLKAYADGRGIAYPDSYAEPGGAATKDDWLDLIFSEVVQPTLGHDAPTLIYDYPASQSQLARTGEANGYEVTRRFELFVNGIELANGYDELLDASVLRARIASVSEERRLDGSPALPRESRLLAAMDSGLPPCSGCAMGVDRLLCVLLGTDRIDDVIAFPTELA